MKAVVRVPNTVAASDSLSDTSAFTHASERREVHAFDVAILPRRARGGRMIADLWRS